MRDPLGKTMLMTVKRCPLASTYMLTGVHAHTKTHENASTCSHTIGTLNKWITLTGPYAEWGSLVCTHWHGTLRTSAAGYLVIESRTEEAQRKSDLLLRDLITSRRGRQTFVKQGERKQEFSLGIFRIHWPSGLSRYFPGIKGKTLFSNTIITI